MFIQNKYFKYYYSIVATALQRKEQPGYYEKHHIIPRCMGGTNDQNNLVKLTAREHFVCHRLLTKMVVGEFKHKLAFAAWQLGRSLKCKNTKINSRTYETLRSELSKTYTGRTRAPFSETHLANMSAAAKTRKKVILSEEQRRAKGEKIKAAIALQERSGTNNSFFGKKHTAEVRSILSEKNKRVWTGVPKTRCSCVYCRKEISVQQLTGLHPIHCKLTPQEHTADSICQH